MSHCCPGVSGQSVLLRLHFLCTCSCDRQIVQGPRWGKTGFEMLYGGDGYLVVIIKTSWTEVCWYWLNGGGFSSRLPSEPAASILLTPAKHCFDFSWVFRLVISIQLCLSYVIIVVLLKLGIEVVELVEEGDI